MAESRYPNPPEGTHICGGSWALMPEEARVEVWEFSEYLRTGGKNAHGSFAMWRSKLTPRGASPQGGTDG